MTLQTPEALYLIIPIIISWFFITKNKANIESFFDPEVLKKISTGADTFSLKTRLKLLLLAMIFMVIALSQPVLPTADIKVKKQFNDLLVAIDISNSMFADDVYPNRFEFAKNKLLNSLASIKNTRIAILGFSNEAVLISPLTSDFLTLRFLVKNLSLDNLDLKGTSIINLLQSAVDLLQNEQSRDILLLSDGGDNTDFSSEIRYAQNNNLKIFIYDISTEKGGTIKDKKGVIKDASGNIVIVKSNQNIRQLADKTAGKYLKYSFKNKDLSTLINKIKGVTSQKNTTIKQSKPQFYYPLILGLSLFFMAFFSLPRKPQ